MRSCLEITPAERYRFDLRTTVTKVPRISNLRKTSTKVPRMSPTNHGVTRETARSCQKIRVLYSFRAVLIENLLPLDTYCCLFIHSNVIITWIQNWVIPHEIDKVETARVFLLNKQKNTKTQKYYNETSTTRVLDNHSISYTEVS